MNSQDYAIFYATEKNWSVFPLIPHDKKPLFPAAHEKGNPCKGECGKVGHGFHDATKDVFTIAEWWSKYPDAGIGIATGDISDFFALDVDPVHDGEETFKRHTSAFGQLPKTITALTGSGGHHYLFKMPKMDVRNSAGKLGAGLDTRGNGGYIATAPTIHPCGTPYKWIEPPSKTMLAESPEWILKMLFANKEAQVINVNPDGAYISGQRNSALTSMAGAMKRKGFTEDAIFMALNVENLNRCVPPLLEAEVRAIAASVGRYEATAAMPLSNRDRATAEWGLVKCVYEWPNIANEYPDIAPADFAQKELADFWTAVRSGIDITTAAANCGLMAELEKADGYQVERVGGYAKAIKTYSYLSRVAGHADTIKHHAVNGNISGLEKAITDMNKIPAQTESRIVSISDVFDEVETEMKERQKNPVEVWGIPYAWKYISLLTGGKQRGELTYLVAEPKIGKSWWCLQDALATATEFDTPTFYWCGEMRRQQLIRRFCQLTGVTGRNMKSGNMNEQDMDLYSDAKALIMNSPLYIDDKPLALHEVRPLLVKQIAEHGIQQAYFDYARLIQAPGKDENEQSKATSIEMKRICQELNIAITVIASVNKQGMDSKSETATKSNISGSGQQVHDADNLYFMTKFDGANNGMAYGLLPHDYDSVKSIHLTASRELDHHLENGFIAYQQKDTPKFSELKRKG
jgi:replicative DNA helicase